jgi:lysophospholipase L1-like esterase
MVVGDSISQGSAGDYTWRYQLYRHLVHDGVHPQMVGPYNWLLNNVTGKQGDCSYADRRFETAHDAVWGRQLADGMTTVKGEVTAYRPSYLLVLLGINDLAFRRTDVSGTEMNLRTFITNARAANPNIKIVLGLLLPKFHWQRALAAQVAEYNGDLPGIAAAMSTSSSPIVVADDATAIRPATDLWDGTHPNARGELKIAAGFAKALATDFKLGSAFPNPLPVLPTGPLVAPSLRVKAGDRQARLSWGLTPGATAYVVYQKYMSAGTRKFVHLPDPLSALSDPWTAAPLEAGGRYEFKLQACKGVNCHVYSNPAVVTVSGVTPAAPRRLRATASDGQALLTWSAAANATGYFVWQKDVTAGDSHYTRLPYPISGTRWIAHGLADGSTYLYKLQSVNGLIKGGKTRPVQAKPTE